MGPVREIKAYCSLLEDGSMYMTPEQQGNLHKKVSEYTRLLFQAIKKTEAMIDLEPPDLQEINEEGHKIYYELFAKLDSQVRSGCIPQIAELMFLIGVQQGMLVGVER